jgi:hypothetical protein
MSSMLPAAVTDLEKELRRVFGTRLLSLVAYGLNARGDAPTDDHGDDAGREPVRTMAIVESLTEQDLRGCASRIAAWHDTGLATPLIVPAHELERSLDVFPLEFEAISADHVVVAGANPFERATVESRDMRRACEVQARSHLLHLREGFVEAGGNPNALAVLIVDSARPLAALLSGLARLEGRGPLDALAAGRHAERILAVPGGVITDVIALTRAHEIAAAEAERIFPTYLAAMERLVEYVDRWQK